MERKYKKSWSDYPRYMGKVVKWFPERGFGFIHSWEDGENYYVHVRQCADGELFIGSVVEFGIMTDRVDPEKKFATHVLTVEVPEPKDRRKVR